MGLIVLPLDGLVRVLCIPGPCAWPMVGFLKGGVEREDTRGADRVFKISSKVQGGAILGRLRGSVSPAAPKLQRQHKIFFRATSDHGLHKWSGQVEPEPMAPSPRAADARPGSGGSVVAQEGMRLF